MPSSIGWSGRWTRGGDHGFDAWRGPECSNCWFCAWGIADVRAPPEHPIIPSPSTVPHPFWLRDALRPTDGRAAGPSATATEPRLWCGHVRCRLSATDRREPVQPVGRPHGPVLVESALRVPSAASLSPSDDHDAECAVQPDVDRGPDGADEIADLATMNQMLDRLEQAQTSQRRSSPTPTTSSARRSPRSVSTPRSPSPTLTRRASPNCRDRAGRKPADTASGRRPHGHALPPADGVAVPLGQDRAGMGGRAGHCCRPAGSGSVREGRVAYVTPPLKPRLTRNLALTDDHA